MGRLNIAVGIANVLMVATLALGADPSPRTLPWLVRSWETEDGLPQNGINAIEQTHDGFLWVGTSGGLARFDGVRFRNFGLHDGLRSVRIAELVEDSQGVLWIGTTGGGLSRWDKGRFTTFGTAEGFPTSANIISMTVDRAGSLWIGTSDGLVQRNGGVFTMIHETQGLPRAQARALASDAEGGMWVSVLEKGVFRGINGKFEQIKGNGPFPTGAYSLLADREGAVWAGEGNGLLWRWREGAWQRFDITHGLPNDSFISLAQDRQGTLWIATRSRGLWSYRGDRFEQVPEQEKSGGQSLSSLLVDREDSVWIGSSYEGLGRLSPSLLRYHGSDAGLGVNSVTSVAEDPSGIWWAGTPTGGLFRFDQGKFLRVTDPAMRGIRSNIYCTATGEDGSVWVAGEQFLYRFRTGQPMQAFADAPIAGEAIRALCPDGDSLWIGTYYSTLMKCDGAGVHVVAPRRTFGGDITSIVREGPEILWIGTSSGLHRWEKGQIRTWDTRDGLPAANVRCLHRDPDGTLWIGTLGGGLARLKDNRFFTFNSHHGLIDDVISQITADDQGAVWLGCNRGIMRIDRRELDAVASGAADLHLIAFGRNEGLTRTQCSGGTSPTVIKTRDGRLLFPTVGGIAEIDPQAIQNLAPAPLLADVERVSVDGRPRSLDTPLVIQPDEHRLEFSYTAPALRGGEWVRFRHRLDGRDTEWTSAGSRRTASYDGLRPGNYVFRVEASDGRGNWHAADTTLAFKVQPYFWQTLWFQLGAACAVIGVNGAAAWLHARRKHRVQLAAMEHTRQHEAELAHASRVSLLGELSASISHELKQPLAAILSNAQAALRFLSNDPADLEEVRSSLKDIATADRRANEIIERMRAMMKKGAVDMELRDLNTDIEQVLRLMRDEFMERGVTVTTQLASDLLPVSGDHIQIQQVMLNLMINGCDAMHDKPAHERELVVQTRNSGVSHVQVSVIDHGTGVPSGLLEKVFEPFYSTKQSGLGMGLSICQAIIKAHGGQLWASNNPDGGATFHFTLTAGNTPAP
ncbi:hypothetical protein AYO49_02040 [Verrucomicrobiaceae bacterium SCGC AG-212-N21]|nr:hypothetical protein AYO49_02040 [Verrucomicrobiaceae bacterium SCGC AG-212-N21]